jgi:hypothetical protein
MVVSHIGGRRLLSPYMVSHPLPDRSFFIHFGPFFSPEKNIPAD